MPLSRASKMTWEGNDFNVAISILFVGYIGVQIPSNIILTRVRPSIYLPICVALWGPVSAFAVAARNSHDLIVGRLFLDILEAPVGSPQSYGFSSWFSCSHGHQMKHDLQ